MIEWKEVNNSHFRYIAWQAGPDFFISYMESNDNDLPETILHIDNAQETHCFILNGDFRKEYESLDGNDLDKFLEFYSSKKSIFGNEIYDHNIYESTYLSLRC